MSLIPTTSLHLDLRLGGTQVRNFRAAIIEATGQDLELLHNKDADGKSVLRYPLVQYRVKGGHAAAWAVGPGCDQLRQWLFSSQGQLRIGGRDVPFRVTDWKDDRFDLIMTPKERPNWYYLGRWLPLKDEPYRDWLKAPNLKARIELLERMLVANIHTFARELDWTMPEWLQVDLQQIVHTRKAKFHGNDFVGFDVVFTANVALPPGLGLGHAVSHGYGIAVPVKPFTKPEEFWDKQRQQQQLEVELGGL